MNFKLRKYFFFSKHVIFIFLDLKSHFFDCIYLKSMRSIRASGGNKKVGVKKVVQKSGVKKSVKKMRVKKKWGKKKIGVKKSSGKKKRE